MIVPIRNSCSWILKVVLKQRQEIQQMQIWDKMLQQIKFQVRKMYNALKVQHEEVSWEKLMYGNAARPMALFVVWMSFQDRLAMKERMHRFGFIDNDICCLCRN